MSRIASAARTTKPTLYRLFDGKAHLFKTVIRGALNEASAQIDDFSEDPRAPHVVLAMVADRMMKSYTGGALPGLWRAALSARQEFPDVHRQTLDLLRQRSIARKLASYFANLDRRGVLRIKYPDMAAHNFALLVGPASELLSMKGAGYGEEERIEEVVRLFLRGYAPGA